MEHEPRPEEAVRPGFFERLRRAPVEARTRYALALAALATVLLVGLALLGELFRDVVQAPEPASAGADSEL